jgi:hypothetical protein
VTAARTPPSARADHAVREFLLKLAITGPIVLATKLRQFDVFQTHIRVPEQVCLVPRRLRSLGPKTPDSICCCSRRVRPRLISRSLRLGRAPSKSLLVPLGRADPCGGAVEPRLAERTQRQTRIRGGTSSSGGLGDPEMAVDGGLINRARDR